MLDEKDLQSIQTMIDASIRASEKRMIAYFDTDVMPKFDLLAEGLQDVQAKLTPDDQNRGHRGRRGSLETGDPLHEQGTGRAEKSTVKNHSRNTPRAAALTIEYKTVYNRCRRALQQAVSPESESIS